MKAYQLVYDEYDLDFGGLRVAKTYSSKEEADKACDWANSLPTFPEDEGRYSPYRVQEIELEDKFTPWLTPEQEAKRRADYQGYMDYINMIEEQEDMDRFEAALNEIQLRELKEEN